MVLKELCMMEKTLFPDISICVSRIEVDYGYWAPNLVTDLADFGDPRDLDICDCDRPIRASPDLINCDRPIRVVSTGLSHSYQ